MKRKIYLLSSTHWDREWYKPFQTMRFRLADTIDELLDVLEQQPDFQLFCLDGQTVVLDDYLQAAPENRERLQKLIQSGRIKIGPWYVMPDTRLVSGESLITNFLEGQRICERWGVSSWKFGYMNDIFGHIAQMPQLLKGFHINGSYLGRGLWTGSWRGFFLWQSPDGTVLPSYLGKYYELTCEVTYHMDDADYEDRLKKIIDSTFADCGIPVIVIADAFDHARVNARTNQMIQDIERLYPDAEVHHETLEQLAEEIKPYWNELPVVNGELIDTTGDRRKVARLVGQSMSSYYPVKYKNDLCQMFMEKLVSPLSVLGRMNGMKYRPALMEKCYDYLLKNHPHDSICGCSVDQVHIDMKYRFDQNLAIGKEIAESALKTLRPESSEDGRGFTIWNPFPYEWKASIRNEFPIPCGFEATFAESAGYEKRNAFRLFDEQGNEIPYHIHGIRKNVLKTTSAQNTRSFDMYDLSMSVPLKPMSYTRIELRPSAVPVRFLNQPFRHGGNFSDNGIIRLTINPDGTLKIFDYATGKTYDGLNRYCDDGEIGNGWFHDTPIQNSLRFASSPSRIERLSDGPAQAVWLIEQEIKLPASDQTTAMTALKLSTRISLWAGRRDVQIDLCLDNQAADHRLRVFCPSGIETDTYSSGQAFCFVERKTGLDADKLDYDEEKTIETSMNGIQYVQGEGCGLAFVAAYGLHEGGVDTDGTISTVLLRSFSRVYLADEPQACKLLGQHNFRYSLVPMDGDTQPAEFVRLQQEMAVELPLQWEDSLPCRQDPLLWVDQPNLLVSAIKVPENLEENGMVVRLWNTSGQSLEGELHTGFALSAAAFTTLDEQEDSPADWHENGVKLHVEPWKIITLRLCGKKNRL